MDFHLPDIEGHFGNEASDPVDVQFGRLDFAIEQLDLTLISPLFQKKPKAEDSFPPGPTDLDSRLQALVPTQTTCSSPSSQGLFWWKK